MTILIQTRPSNGARVLRDAIRAEGINCRIRRRSAVSRLRASSMLINWGCSSGTQPPHLNNYDAVEASVDKRDAFEVMGLAGVRLPLFTVGRTISASSTNDTDNIWLKRTLTQGHGGRGIEVVRPGEEWGEPAPLYVQYVPKLQEFRVHVFAVDDDPRCLSRQKLGVNGFGRDRNQQLIRNTDNGWVLGLVRDSQAAFKAEEEAVKAVYALGLDFAAVDVIIGRDDGLAYVLEANTAPGIEAEPVVDFYKTNFIRYYRSGQWS